MKTFCFMRCEEITIGMLYKMPYKFDTLKAEYLMDSNIIYILILEELIVDKKLHNFRDGGMVGSAQHENKWNRVFFHSWGGSRKR